MGAQAVIVILTAISGKPFIQESDRINQGSLDINTTERQSILRDDGISGQLGYSVLEDISSGTPRDLRRYDADLLGAISSDSHTDNGPRMQEFDIIVNQDYIISICGLDSEVGVTGKHKRFDALDYRPVGEFLHYITDSATGNYYAGVLWFELSDGSLKLREDVYVAGEDDDGWHLSNREESCGALETNPSVHL